MRINNNLMAMNTHRQLSINGSNTQKSIEKLSSGYRINRAGDDAAGLAISEKMRAQIRGLDQASRNSQDSISLIQTAEGALGETQSILQRMRELAVQSANDTNVDADRSEIQKEINQLTSEINRIGNTTEFNNQKLLSGDISVTGDGKVISAGATLDTGVTGIDVDVNGTAAAETYDVKVTSDTVAKIENTVLSNVTDADVTADSTVDLVGGAYKVEITAEDTKQLDGAATDAASILDTDGGNTAITLESNSSLADHEHQIDVVKAQKASAVAGGIEITAGQLDNIDSGNYTITTERVFNDAATDITATGAATKNALTEGVISNFKISDTATAADVAAINTEAAGAGAGGLHGIDITIADDGNNNGVAQITFSDGTNTVVVTTDDPASGAQTIALGGIEFDVNVSDILEGVTNVGQAGQTIGVGSSSYTATEITIANDAIHDQVTVSDGINTVSDSVVSQTGGAMTFDLDGGGDDFFLTSTPADFVQGNTLNVTVQSEYTISLKDNDSGTQIGIDQVVDEIDIAANPNALTNLSFGGSGSLIDLDAAALQGKASGTYSVTFDVKTDSGYTAELKKADGSAVDGASYALEVDGTDGKTIDLGHDVVLNYDGVAGDLGTGGDIFFGVNDSVTEFTMELTNDGGTVTYDTQKGDAGDTFEFANGVSVTTDNTLANSAGTITFDVENTEVDNSLSMQVGANKGQSFSVDISDMRSTALGVAGTTASATADGVGTEAAGASFVATKDVTDGTSSTGTEYALDVSSHEKATAAVEVINQAIEAVSAERSKLGAFQNRLEYTIRNLDTSSENLQASESRIRDVDMAKEMMEFTKNNILQQAAQSMLAQANQQPQGVLQLLR